MLIQETRGSKIFDYSYDANGNIRMLKYTVNANVIPTYYYYALNSRGDVIGLYDSNGNLTAKYTYDAWGNEVSVTYQNGNVITHDNHIAKLQPFRYRSYYYDSDSSLYYLQSRYYDPVTHRFINADGYVSTGTGVIGYNMFAYCNNNPVNNLDYSGERTVKTLEEYQTDLTSGKHTGYSIMDITMLQKAGYGSSDRFFVKNNGTLSHYSFFYQLYDTTCVCGESIESSFGLGYGLGLGFEIDDVELKALFRADLVMFSLSLCEGFDIGHILEASFSILLDELSWEEIQYESFLDPSKNYTTLDGNVPNKTEIYSIGGYVIIGGNFTISFNQDYYNMRRKEIWGW